MAALKPAQFILAAFATVAMAATACGPNRSGGPTAEEQLKAELAKSEASAAEARKAKAAEVEQLKERQAEIAKTEQAIRARGSNLSDEERAANEKNLAAESRGAEATRLRQELENERQRLAALRKDQVEERKQLNVRIREADARASRADEEAARARAEAAQDAAALPAGASEAGAAAVAEGNAQTSALLGSLKPGEAYPVLLSITVGNLIPLPYNGESRTAIVRKALKDVGYQDHETAKIEVGGTNLYAVQIRDVATLTQLLAALNQILEVKARAFPISEVIVQSILTVEYTKPGFPKFNFEKLEFQTAFEFEPLSGSSVHNFKLKASQPIAAGVRLPTFTDLTKEAGFGFLSKCNGLSPECMVELRSAGLLENVVTIDGKSISLREHLANQINHSLKNHYLKGGLAHGWGEDDRAVKNLRIEFIPGIEVKVSDAPKAAPVFFALPGANQVKSMVVDKSDGVRGALMRLLPTLQK